MSYLVIIGSNICIHFDNVSIVTCKAGFYLNNGQCDECAIGSYKPLEGNTECTSCPDNTTTEGMGAIVEQQCGKIVC